MKELIRKLTEAGKQEALINEESIRAAAKEIGIPDSEIDEALAGYVGFPLDEGEVAGAAGGGIEIDGVYYGPAYTRNNG